MNNCRAKAERRADKANSLVGHDMMPIMLNFNRNRRRSDRSSVGGGSSLTNSIDTFFSGAWSSVSDFFENITEKGEDALEDIKKKINLEKEGRDREERRRSVRKRYRNLYMNKLKSTSEKDTVDNLGLPELQLATETQQRRQIQDDIFEKGVHLCTVTTPSSIVNTNFKHSTEKAFGSACENVQRWFSSNSDSNNSSKVSVDKICYKRTNSDLLPRKFTKPVFHDVGTKLSDAKSLQTLSSDDLIDSSELLFKKYEEISSPSGKNVIHNSERKKKEHFDRIPDEKSQLRIPIQDDQRRKKDQVDQSFDVPSTDSMKYSDRTVQVMDKANVLGTINLVVEYIVQSNMLKLTVEGICMRDNVYDDSTIFIKVYMTLENEIKKKCTKDAKGRKLMFLKQEIFLQIGDPSSANLPLIRLVICKRKTLFGKYRYKPIAETLFYVNKESFDEKLELSKILTKCS